MATVLEQIEGILAQGRQALETAQDLETLEAVRVHYLGRKGALSGLMAELTHLPTEERPAVGRALNHAKKQLENLLAARLATLNAAVQERRLAAERVDVTLPGRGPEAGHAHPVNTVLAEIVRIFRDLGFQVAEGPEVELDYYNFEALNFPPDHPARDMQDTFFIDDDVVLRTHTSPVQIRVMERFPPPVRIIAPGKVYRCDADVSHTPMFHQVEGFHVEEQVSMADLKGTLAHFARRCFGADVAVRFRPSFFPFVEPGAEMDIQCVICGGQGCRVCKGSGWLEILGAGMIHPNVLQGVNYDPERYTGFAFGMGVERITMLKYGIDDIRLFFENDLRFLRQF